MRRRDYDAADFFAAIHYATPYAAAALLLLLSPLPPARHHFRSRAAAAIAAIATLRHYADDAATPLLLTRPFSAAFFTPMTPRLRRRRRHILMHFQPLRRRLSAVFSLSFLQRRFRLPPDASPSRLRFAFINSQRHWLPLPLRRRFSPPSPLGFHCLQPAIAAAVISDYFLLPFHFAAISSPPLIEEPRLIFIFWHFAAAASASAAASRRLSPPRQARRRFPRAAPVFRFVLLLAAHARSFHAFAR
jgi:hypothetical protein